MSNDRFRWHNMRDVEVYLGDGLYVSFDGFSFRLRAPREHGDHWVALEPDVLNGFLDFVALARGDNL